MKAAILEKQKHIVIKDIPIPKYTDDEVLVRIKEVGLCGSDVHYYNEGRAGDFIIKKPIILGHESSGVVTEVGRNVKSLKKGDRVAIEPGVPCYKCDFCKSGKYNLCSDVKFMATPPYNGSFTEYVNYDPNFLYKIPDSISFTKAALIEPLSVGYSCMLSAKIKPGDSICIMGAGPIGLACLEMAKIAGATKIIVTDINGYRLNLAKDHGANLAINILLDNLLKRIDSYTNSLGVDSVIEASGNENSVFDSIKVVNKGGKVVWVGVGKNQLSIPYIDVIVKEISIEGIFRYKNTYKPIIALLEAKKLNLDGWVSHRYNLDEIQKAFDVANDPDVDKLKIIIEI
ncbi:MAG: NAD(P)-dependent alcohol dehydrogenase [Actinobacteria bacterium]|nr:NAD(P)-dependent alcohol dehydrogenase [Actinomycetota bacterium]